MIRSILNLITYLINDFKFLGFYGGFWFLSVPLITLVICAEKSKCEKDKLNAAEDFNDIDDIEELPLHSIEFKVNNTEKWQIGQVLKRMNYNTVDDLVRNVLNDIL
ncbi:hypothetical protein [Clostridium butyricum]|uniref:hypothetical protein n=1 Tax=Clostridium butyricum TaxID=1492 RepID=UPI00071E9E3D|nr:hypothetical protein [Clostridium butyricum]ALR90185.1 hypothetical protein ATN24_17105 [Clostridium butyricum]ALS19070.1 hypothetical protein ATD26_19560 [Clostridium butyricum]ANF16257.1 hypothetical protein AZ909_19595 [Clostridium butyricum]AOR96168.1 hypothetical protein BBB49_19065 [Clostridium butyricum]MCI3010295.1 hypothetical protein [Clostridium butyricum]